MTNWQAAQAVQHSAFSDGSNYRSHDATAILIRTALGDGSAASPKAFSSSIATRVHIVASGDTLFAIAQLWGVSLQVVEAANPNAGHPPGNFDEIQPGDWIVHP